MAQPLPAEALNTGSAAFVTAVDPRMLKAVAPVYIFNVGPERHSVSRGGLGTKIIPGCPAGERVSEALEITGIYPEHRNLGEAVVCNYIHGIDLARDIIGATTSTIPTKHEFTTNLEWKGVFMSMSPEPSDAEIEKAKAKRREWLMFFVEDGDRRSLNGDGENGTGGIGRNHRNACHELKLKRAWANPVIPQEECPACGSAIKAGIAVCPHCTAIVDEARARKFFPERFAPPAAAAPVAEASSEAAPKAAVESGKPIFDRSKQGK